jgi:protocatechuate 3,4-dioxygenase beta subunit
MKPLYFCCLLILSSINCKSQESDSASIEIIGGPCEGCEAIYEYGDQELSPTTTLPGYQDNEPKLHIAGTIFNKDHTPAENVIVYIYHTNREGIYETRGDETGWARRHGFIRGWIKTGKDGKYEILTFRPGAYPGRTEPEHIHLTVKEPGYSEYYIDDIVFDDDPLLTLEKRSELKNRAGSGLIVPEMKDGILTVSRDIFLGENIPGYK